MLGEKENDDLKKNRHCGRGVGSARSFLVVWPSPAMRRIRPWSNCSRARAVRHARRRRPMSARSAIGRTCSRFRSRSTIGTGSAGRTRSRSLPGRRASTPMRGRMGRQRLHAPGGRQRPGRGRRLGAGALAGLMSRGDRGAGGPSVGFSGGAVTVGAGAAPAGGADVWLARYIPHAVEVTIPRGENGGHTLPYTHVVREMVLLGKWRGEAAISPCAGGERASPRRRSCRQRGRADHRGGETVEAARTRRLCHSRESGNPGAPAKSGCALSRA